MRRLCEMPLKKATEGTANQVTSATKLPVKKVIKLVNRGPAGLLKKVDSSQRPKIVNRGPAGLIKKKTVKAESNGEEKIVLEERPVIESTRGEPTEADINNFCLVEIETLVPDPLNARIHPERNCESIRESLQIYGQVKPIIVRKETMVVVAGNGTLEQAKSLGWKKVLVRYMEDMTEVEAAGYGIADNRTAELARWDLEVVSRIERLMNDSNHPSVGWTRDELETLRAEYEPPETKVEEEGKVDSLIIKAIELQKKWSTKAGQVWEIPSKSYSRGTHRLMCGNSGNAENVSLLMIEEKAKLINTDPPYGVSVDSVYRKDGRNHGRDGSEIAGDKNEKTSILVLDDSMAVAVNHLTDDAAWYLWHAHSLSVELFKLFTKHLGNIPRALIVWMKSHFVIGRNHYHQQHEPCLYGWKENNQPPFYGERNQSTIWEVKGGGGTKHIHHPTEKPVELFTKPILNHLRIGEIAYEPFSGSGTQLVAAERTGRLCYAMEIDPKFVAVALERLASIGLEPKLLEE
jgi:DNA modification methylase